MLCVATQLLYVNLYIELAQSLLGSVAVPPLWMSPTFVAPAIPWLPMAIVIVATAALTLAAAVAPTRIATRTAPVEALAE